MFLYFFVLQYLVQIRIIEIFFCKKKQNKIKTNYHFLLPKMVLKKIIYRYLFIYKKSYHPTVMIKILNGSVL